MQSVADTPALGQAHVYVVCIGQPQPEELARHMRYLSADEIVRAERFVVAPPRERYIVTRSALRHVLAGIVATTPGEIAFAYERRGKPSLKHAAGIHFNVSHSSQHAMIAVAHTPLGIDLETPSTSIRMHSLATSVLSSGELQATRDQPPRVLDAQVLDLWVAKEAFLKALGVGLAGGMQRISFRLPLVDDAWFSPAAIDGSLQLELEESGSCARNAWLDATSWKLRYLPAPAGSRAAIAVSSSVQSVDIKPFVFR